MKKYFLLWIFLFPLNLSWGVSPADLTLIQGVEEYRLANGLRVILKEENSVPLTGIAVSYNIGFRNDKKGNSGLSHLLEHMMFRATSNYAEGALSKALDELGAQNNAFTSYERTVYWEILPASGVEQALFIEADRMVNSLFSPDAFEKEKNVVLSELSAHEGNPQMRLSRALLEQTFGDHPFTYDYGLLSDMSNANRDFVYHKLYRRYYTPNNATLLIVGNMNKPRIKAWISRYFGSIKSDSAFRPEPVQPLQWNLEARVEMEGVASEDFGVILYRLPTRNLKDPDYLALSFLNWAGIINNFSYWPTSDGGIGFGEFTRDPDYPAETIDPQYIRDNFSYFKERLLNRERMDYDSIRSILMTLAWLDNDGSYRDYDVLVKAFSALTAEDIIRVIQTYLTRENSVTGFFKATTRDKNVKPQSSRVVQEDHGGDIDYSELQEFSPEQLQSAQARFQEESARNLSILESYLSEVKQVTLSNGLTLIYRPFSLNDKVSLQVGVKGGQIYQKKAFQSVLTHSFVFEGGPQILLKNQLTRQGGTFSTSLDFNFSIFKAEIPREDFTTALEMTALSLKDRVFIPLLLEEKKTALLRQIQMKKLDSSSANVSREALYRAMFGPQGAGLDYQVKPGDILSLQVSDLQDFYRSQYQPSRTTITVVGKVDFAAFVREAERLFGDWKDSTLAWDPAPLPRPDRTTYKKVPVVNTMQNVIRMAGPTVAYSDATNYLAFVVGNMIFGGGGMTSQLMRVIRDQAGLTYGVYTFPYVYGTGTLFGLYMQNAPADVKKALGLFYQELDKFRSQGPTAMEIVKFKGQLANETLFQYENASRVAETLLLYQLRRGNYRYDLVFLNLLRTMEDSLIRRVMQEALPRHFTIIEAGR